MPPSLPTRSLCPLLRFQFASLHDVGGAQGVIYCAPLFYFSIFLPGRGRERNPRKGEKLSRAISRAKIYRPPILSPPIWDKNPWPTHLTPPPRFHIFSLFLFPPPCLGHTAATEEKRRQRLTRKGRKKGAKILAKKKLGNAFAHETLVISRNILLYRPPTPAWFFLAGTQERGDKEYLHMRRKGGGDEQMTATSQGGRGIRQRHANKIPAKSATMRRLSS